MSENAFESLSDADKPSDRKAYVRALYDEMELLLARQRDVVLRCLDGLSVQADDTVMFRRQQKLQEAVRDAIVVLEETKQSFKSKRLAELRANLERVLSATSL